MSKHCYIQYTKMLLNLLAKLYWPKLKPNQSREVSAQVCFKPRGGKEERFDLRNKEVLETPLHFNIQGPKVRDIVTGRRSLNWNKDCWKSVSIGWSITDRGGGGTSHRTFLVCLLSCLRNIHVNLQWLMSSEEKYRVGQCLCTPVVHSTWEWQNIEQIHLKPTFL